MYDEESAVRDWLTNPRQANGCFGPSLTHQAAELKRGLDESRLESSRQRMQAWASRQDAAVVCSFR